MPLDPRAFNFVGKKCRSRVSDNALAGGIAAPRGAALASHRVVQAHPPGCLAGERGPTPHGDQGMPPPGAALTTTCATQLCAHGPSRTCIESNKEEKPSPHSPPGTEPRVSRSSGREDGRHSGHTKQDVSPDSSPRVGTQAAVRANTVDYEGFAPPQFQDGT